MKKNSLWQQTDDLNELEQIIDQVVDDDSLSPEAREEKLQQLFNQWLEADDNWQERIEACGYRTKCLEKEAEAIKSMIDDLKDRLTIKQNEISRLKHYMQNAMQLREQTKIKGKYSTIFIKTNPPSVLLKTEPEDLPPQFQKIKVEADKTKLKQALKADKNFPYATWQQPTTSLNIRIK